MSQTTDKSKALIFRVNDHGQGPELLRQVFLERGWIEFDEDDNEDYEWNIWWRTSRFRNSDYDKIYPWQRLNHYPKSTGITKKDCLARNLKRMKGVHGAGVYNFSPLAFNLPNDYTRFVGEYGRLKQQLHDSKNLLWICKPADLSRGRGIFLFRDISELQYDCNAVVQRYIHNPLLIGGYKFDIRVYVAIPSFHPLNIYIFEEGLVRFGTEKFDLNSLHNVFSHLTNTSINKHSPGYAVDKERVGPGCKWTITQLRHYLHQNNINDNMMWIRIVNIIILTMLVQSPQVPKSENCFELYGFDILVDENLKPWLLEVNFSPALSYDCQADILVKKPLLHDLLSLMNYKEVDKERGGEAFKKQMQRAKMAFTDGIDRHSSMSHISHRGTMLRKSTSYHKNLSALGTKPTPVQENVPYIEQEREKRTNEKLCFGLPLVNNSDNDGRRGSVSSGVSSADSDQLETAHQDSGDARNERQKTGDWALQYTTERSATANSYQLSSRKYDDSQDYSSSQVKGNVMHTSIGPVSTTLERSSTMSSVVRKAENRKSITASLKSSDTYDSGFSNYSGSSDNCSDMASCVDNQSRNNPKLLPFRQKTVNTLSQVSDDADVGKERMSSAYGRNFNIKSLRPTENSNMLRKISSSGQLASKSSNALPQTYRSRTHLVNGEGDLVQNKSSIYGTRQSTQGRRTPGVSGNYTSRSSMESRLSRTQLYVAPSPVPRKNSRTSERENNVATSRKNGSNSRVNSRARLISVPKSKGPPPRIGDFFLAFPFNDITLKTANSSLDPHVVIKETQRLLRESLHMVDKGTLDQKRGGCLPYGAQNDSDRLWGPVKLPVEET